MKTRNPYSAGLWTNKKIKKNEIENVQNIINSIEGLIKISELQAIFRRNLKDINNKNMTIVHSKSIKYYLERLGSKFPDHQYSFMTLNKAGCRYARVIGINVRNKKTGNSISHDCNIECLDLPLPQITKKFKRIRIETVLRKVKSI